MGIIEHDGKQYHTVFGSYTQDGLDGMFLELHDPAGTILEAHYNDLDDSFSFSTAGEIRLPVEVVEAFLREARERLPPDGDRRFDWMKTRSTTRLSIRRTPRC